MCSPDLWFRILAGAQSTQTRLIERIKRNRSRPCAGEAESARHAAFYQPCQAVWAESKRHEKAWKSLQWSRKMVPIVFQKQQVESQEQLQARASREGSSTTKMGINVKGREQEFGH